MSSAVHYVSEAAVVSGSDIIRKHSNPGIRSLAGKTVKVYPDTAYDVFSQGNRLGKTVMVIPIDIPGDMESRWILTRHLRSSDPVILNLQT